MLQSKTVSTRHWQLSLNIFTTADRGTTPSQLYTLRVSTIKPWSICCSNTHRPDLPTQPPSHPSSLALWPYQYIRQLVEVSEPSDPDWLLSYTLATFWKWQGKINVDTAMRANNPSLCHLFSFLLSHHWCTIF